MKIVNDLMNYVLELKKYAEETHEDEESLYSRGEYSSCLERWGRERGLESDMEFFKSVLTNQHKNRIIVRYDLRAMGQEMWEDENSIYRECRSIVINIEKEEIVILPFQKFFNIGEVSENKEESLREEIEKCEVFEVADKLDGSMQNASMDGDEIVLAGSRAIDPDNSWRLELGKNMMTDGTKLMITVNPELTFSFELIHEDNVHVVNYDDKENGLYLIGIRSKEDGRQFPYSAVEKVALAYEVPYAKKEQKSLDQLLIEMKEIRGDEKEGWVMYIDGRLVKIKCDDFVFLHRAIGGMTSPKAIMASIVEGAYDDFYSKVPETIKPRVEAVAELCSLYEFVMESRIEEAYNDIIEEQQDIADFMVKAQRVPTNIRSYVIRKRKDMEYDLLRGKKYSFILNTLMEEGILIEK